MQNPQAEGTTYGDWRDQLSNDGYAVVKNVISPEKAKDYTDRMMAWLETFPFGFRRDKRATWTQDHLPENLKGGMYQKYCVQHESFMWDARQEPGMIEAFSKVWGTSKLLASFDGMNITFPVKPEKGEKPKAWPHVDQNPEKKGLHCVQGILNLAPNGPKDGGLIVLRGSHKLQEEFFKNGDKSYDPEVDWYSFKDKEVNWFEKQGCKWTKVCAEPGDLLLWDSRTMHYNLRPEGDIVRTVMYICYTPASFATPEGLGKKAAFFNARQGTTHWPHLSSPLGNELGGAGGKNVYSRSRPHEEPEETDLVLQLAGVLPYDD